MALGNPEEEKPSSLSQDLRPRGRGSQAAGELEGTQGHIHTKKSLRVTSKRRGWCGIMRKSLHLLSLCVLTYKMGGTPSRPVSEAAVGNSSSTFGGKFCKNLRVMQMYGNVTVNSENGTHP